MLECHRRHVDEYLDRHGFDGSVSLENFGDYLRRSLELRSSSVDEVLHFVKWVCAWGGDEYNIALTVASENAEEVILQRFETACSSMERLRTATDRELRDRALSDAIGEIISLHGLGISYGSKMLRMLRPDLCGVMDSTVESFVVYSPPVNGELADQRKTRGQGNFAWYSRQCVTVAEKVGRAGIAHPEEGRTWRASDVDAVVFTEHRLTDPNPNRRWTCG
jgi:hypothetical protein